MLYSRYGYIPQTRRKLPRYNINNSPLKSYTLGLINRYCECYANRKLLSIVLVPTAVKGPLITKDRDCYTII